RATTATSANSYTRLPSSAAPDVYKRPPVADAPGDRDSMTQPAPIATAAGAEHGRDILGLGGFFTEVQPHGHHIRSG
ncbi:hypothetical protein, partial [Pseudomonas sp. PA-4-8C]|uniref:hypothetical protein n=1 Tax=Pseudomonas sp. PA-4-8C TaxID=2665476 RepID=UPI001F16669C